MGALATATALGAAAVLLWAGLEKARSPRALRTTLGQLGLRRDAALVTAALVAGLEVAVALALIFGPGSAWTLAGLVALSTGFTLAGAIALSREGPIYCSCFGPGRKGRLGKPQLLFFPLWLAVMAVLRLGDPMQPSLAEGAAFLAVMAVAMATVRAVGVLTVWREARGDRRSAQEMLVWLP